MTPSEGRGGRAQPGTKTGLESCVAREVPRGVSRHGRGRRLRRSAPSRGSCPPSAGSHRVTRRPWGGDCLTPSRRRRVSVPSCLVAPGGLGAEPGCEGGAVRGIHHPLEPAAHAPQELRLIHTGVSRDKNAKIGARWLGGLRRSFFGPPRRGGLGRRNCRPSRRHQKRSACAAAPAIARVPPVLRARARGRPQRARRGRRARRRRGAARG